jgi:hypothetical protein
VSDEIVPLGRGIRKCFEDRLAHKGGSLG